MGVYASQNGARKPAATVGNWMSNGQVSTHEAHCSEDVPNYDRVRHSLPASLASSLVNAQQTGYDMSKIRKAKATPESQQALFRAQ